VHRERSSALMVSCHAVGPLHQYCRDSCIITNAYHYHWGPEQDIDYTHPYDTHGEISYYIEPFLTIRWRDSSEMTAACLRFTPHPGDSLIRYLATPVWSNTNGTGKVIGALVAGDIVNGKVSSDGSENLS